MRCWLQGFQSLVGIVFGPERGRAARWGGQSVSRIQQTEVGQMCRQDTAPRDPLPLTRIQLLSLHVCHLAESWNPLKV